MKATVFPATIPSFSQHVQNDVYDITEETVEVDKDDTIWVINEDQVESISNEVPEAQNEDENRDHEEHTEDETISNLINPTEHANVERRKLGTEERHQSDTNDFLLSNPTKPKFVNS